MQSVITTLWLENIINQYLQLDPEGLSQMAVLEGKVLCVDIAGINQQYYVFPEEQGVRIQANYEYPADAVIRGLPTALLKLAMAEDSAPLMLSGEIEITGDVGLGRAFKKCLSSLQIDWEEHFSKFVGDVPANMAFSLIGEFSSWAKKVKASLTDNVSEYLQEESRDVISGAELEQFNKQVDQLRDDVDRLEALLKK